MQDCVRIGGASGFWGDSAVGAPQLVASGNIDFLVFDYLAELTMSILAAARAKNPEMGYATDFVQVAMRAVLRDAVDQGIRVISNAGGVNPRACAQALQALAQELGVQVRIAVVEGDDVLHLQEALRDEDVRELQSGAPMPPKLLTANAYLGALPVRQALDAGAQVVITGRCVDSAVTLGALMHAFDWSERDWDRLAGGSLAGHIIECGCQATGGLHTDWDQVPDWAHMGYPIVECAADGSFVLTKPAGTGGLVAPAAVAEQLLYEIGDPAAYVLPDVVADFTAVRIERVGEHRVRVHGAKGREPTASYKVCATYMDGFRCNAQLTLIGVDAVEKARRTAEAILTRTREMLAQAGLGDYSATHVDVVGSESGAFGPHARGAGAREVTLHLAVTHRSKAALDIFSREIAPAGTSWSPGTTGAGGRRSPSPSIKQFAFLLDKDRVQPRVRLGDTDLPALRVPKGAGLVPALGQPLPPTPQDPEPAPDADALELPLIRLAYARSGDKGDQSNIGVIARDPRLLPLLREQLTPARVRAWLGHLVRGEVQRFELPGIGAFNFLCSQSLGGGGMASLRSDPLGKGMGQILLCMPVRVPRSLLEEGAVQHNGAVQR